MERDDELECLARIAIDCGYHLHKELGPGLLESVYEILMAEELRARGLDCRKQVPVPIRYNSVVVDNAFKIDLLIENRLVIELKSVERRSPVHAKQLLTYIRLMQLPLGLLMNFGMATFKDGLSRIANEYRSGWRSE